MTADEKRKAVKAAYEEILGRNRYSQDSTKRQCVFAPYKDGAYYSDCSSSILNAYCNAGILDWHEGNTATIHYQGTLAAVPIVNGIPDESSMRIGDCLMFRGNDPGRPLQIGHVEMYAGNGILYGHGSGNPSAKEMKAYCESRQRQRASNGLSKGLVEVRRFIQDDRIETAIYAVLQTTAELNCRIEPDISSPIVKTYCKGTYLKAGAKCNRWFRTPDGWVSAAYLQGWVEEGGRWWYLMPGYTWPAKTVMTINGDDYAFDRDGWMISADRIGTDGEIQYKKAGQI